MFWSSRLISIWLHQLALQLTNNLLNIRCVKWIVVPDTFRNILISVISDKNQIVDPMAHPKYSSNFYFISYFCQFGSTYSGGCFREVLLMRRYHRTDTKLNTEYFSLFTFTKSLVFRNKLYISKAWSWIRTKCIW